MKTIRVAIDGPAGSGKSSLAKSLAKDFGLLYLDTGAMYRAFTLHALRAAVPAEEGEALTDLLAHFPLTLRNQEGELRCYLGEEDISQAIREPSISQAVSRYAALPSVRRHLLQLQQNFAQNQGVIMDGRDIGTRVLPEAELKVFLTASLEERARRRQLELQQSAQPQDFDSLKEALRQRDEADQQRAEAPLKQAEDARLLDTTELSFEEVKQELASWIQACLDGEREESGVGRSVTDPAETVTEATEKSAENPSPKVEKLTKRPRSQEQVEGKKKPYPYRSGPNLDDPKQRGLRSLVLFLLRILMALLFRIRYEGVENIPKQAGPLFLVANHTSAFDMMAIVRHTPFWVYWVGKDELVQYPLLRQLLSWWRMIPVDRVNLDMTAAKSILQRIKEGHVVGIFPEAARLPEGADLKKYPPRNGVAQFAVRHQVPILPVCIEGRFKPFAKLTIHYGKPFVLPYDKKDLRRLTDQASYEIMQAVYEQMGVSYPKPQEWSEQPDNN